MQEQINEKTVAISIKTARLTAEVLQKAIRKLLDAKKHKAPKIYRGKQTLKHLMKQNTGVSNIEITEGNIKAFESTAKKYGIDFALKKDATCDLIDIHPDLLYLRCHCFYVRMVYLDNVPVNGNLAQIRRHVACGDELHFFLNQFPFFLCHIEFDLYCPFASVHRFSLLSVLIEGLGHFPTSNF